MSKEVDPVDILSDITVFMKYAKYDRELKRRETWDELVERNERMHLKKFPALEAEIKEAYKYVYSKKILPSMRSLQFGGKPIENSPNRTYNCAFLAMDHPLAFSELMFLLLGGSGDGFSVQRHHVEKLPEINKPNPKRHKRFLIGDSIEGWADAIKVLFKAYFEGRPTPVFDYSDIRKKNAPLITSGGKAPGPQPLKDCIHAITAILDAKEDGEQLKPIEVYDCVCHVADAVLSGGIRRAALLALFSFDDEEMIAAKSGAWWELNPQRGRANNSACIIRHKIKEQDFLKYWKKIELSKAGEPGFLLSNDPEWGTNPCCFTGDMLLSTSDGYKSFTELAKRGYCQIENLFGKRIDGYVKWTGKKECVRLKLSNGDELKCTPDHRLFNGTEFILAEKSQGCYLANKYNEDLFVESVEAIGPQNVYDFTLNYDFIVNEFDNPHDLLTQSEVESIGIVNGVYVHNCEIALRICQFCNLTEINGKTVENQADFNLRAKYASFIGTLQASYTDFHYLRDIWRQTTEKDALIGVGITGICSGRVLDLDLTEAAKVVVSENERVAKLIGINPAARTTTVKPSGTTSLVLGSSSGIHGWHAKWYIRRIRVGKNEGIYKYLLENHPELVEDDYFKPYIQAVISVPQKAPDGAIFRDESVFDLLERVKRFNQEWIKPGHRSGVNSHNVSATISIKDDEWDAVGDWMWKNREFYNGLSVLPYDGGTYVQAPFEEITEEKYNELVKHLHSIDLTQVIEEDDETNLNDQAACAGGACEII